MTDSIWYKLRAAVVNREYEQAETIIRAHPSVKQLRNGIGETVLHYLAVENDREAVAWLYNHGFCLDVKNEFGIPVFFEVAQLGCVELLAWLIAEGVDIDALDGENRNIRTFLEELGKKEMAQFLFEGN